MNRQIKFRGKANDGRWVYGSLVDSRNIQSAIYFETGKGKVKTMDFVYVQPETVCQFIKNFMYDGICTDLYNNDIVLLKLPYDDNEYIAHIFYDETFCGYRANIRMNGGIYVHNLTVLTLIKVIGNFYDNIELL